MTSGVQRITTAQGCVLILTPDPRVRSCAGTPPSGTGAHVQLRVPLNPIIHGPFRGSFHQVEKAFPTPMDNRTSRLMTPTWWGPPCWSRTWRPPSTKTPSFMRIELISPRGDDSANRTAPGYGPRRSPRDGASKNPASFPCQQPCFFSRRILAHHRIVCFK